MKITLKNVASYREQPETLETDKKVNLVYGLNGTGKTTISDFLYHYQDPEHGNEQFRDCALEGFNDEKILVYNQSFIRGNFYEQDELKGIFTLSKENKEAEEAIKKATENRQSQQVRKEKREEKKQSNTKLKGAKLTRIQDIAWSIKTKYTGGDRVLEFCLHGLRGGKEKLFNHIKDIQKPEIQPSKTIEQLEQEAQSISGKNAEPYSNLKPINLDIRNIEESDIWNEVIVGKEQSLVAELIKKLNNSDWVRQGISYLPSSIEGIEQCPFCQEETITAQVAQNIKEYFDETYEAKKNNIKQLKNQYEQAVNLPTMDDYKKHPLIGEYKDKFENFYNQLQRSLEQNLAEMQTKLEKPSQQVAIDGTQDKLAKLNDLISGVNQEIQRHNGQIENPDHTKRNIKDEFWRIMRWDYDAQISSWQKENAKLLKDIQDTEREIEEINSTIRKYDEEIREQQKSIVNIDEAISNINDGLQELGIEGFCIQKYQGNSYRIVREGQTTGQFPTLSEGEKMIISFLYFMELCKGRESEEETGTETEKIIIIDDPVSSLSHTYIYNLSVWIEKYFFNKNYKNVLVLTHSLYFFHELIRRSNDKKLFRLTKSDSGTQIQPMQQDEINNEYESYWQVIKDHGNDRATDALLANSMRNILEHFFGFIDKSKLKDGLDRLGEGFEAFKRYMNKESHSDRINITDYKEIDVQQFKNAFKEVFIKSGYREHYNKMMDKS